jgi:hypothetical protein
VIVHPPYVYYDEQIVYPVLKEEAALGRPLNVSHSQKLTIEFNCLGIAARNTLILYIKVPMHKPIQLLIDKECSKGTSLLTLHRDFV